MKKLFAPLFAILALLAGTGIAQADKSEDAQALVSKAIAYYDQVGRDAAFQAFNDKSNGEFVFGEYYVIVAEGQNGNFLTHAINPKLINQPKLLWGLKDVNSKFIIRDMVEVGKASPDGGWSDYVWTHPETKKLANKKTWVQAHDGLLFMVGFYE